MSAAPAVISSKEVISVSPNGGRGPIPKRARSGDASSSSDEINTRVRKPYTITKQREKWTEQEHQKFLEALKLYGRSWHHIKEHIGTKTTVQIRSHAQKFFVKVERGVSNNDVNGEIQEIEIPPPRPKRKPNHPYPRKAGSSPSLLDKNEDVIVAREVANMSSKRIHGTQIPPAPSEESAGGYYPSENGNDQVILEEFRQSTKESNSVSTGYSLPANHPVFSAPIQNTLEANVLPGAIDVVNSKNMGPVSALSDKVALQNDKQSEANPLIRQQIHMCGESRGKSSDLQVHVNTNSPAYCEAEVPVYDSRVQAESQHAYIHPTKKQENHSQNSLNLSLQNNMGTSTDVKAKASEQSFPHDSYFSYYGCLPTLGRLQTTLAGPAHEHFTYATSPWQFMQAPFINHPAAFAAAMAAAAWAMRGTGSNVNQLPSSEDLKAAAFAAASASWWALHGLAQHTHNPLTGGAFRPSHMQSTAESTNTPEQRFFGKPCSGEKERTELPSLSPETYKAQEKLSAEPEKISCNIPDTAKHLSPSADDLDVREHTTGEGSSSGSNTPALMSNSSEQDIPSLSENDNDRNIGLCIPVDDGRKRAFHSLSEDVCIKPKAKTSERGRPQQKESRHGEHDNGKRLKSSNHEMEFRKEVSSQGRKAFEALFTCRTLPQTFSREEERSNITSPKQMTVQQTAPNSMECSSASQAEVMTHNESNCSRECALMTENNEPNTTCFKPSSSMSEVDMLRICSSLSNKPRASMSGFIPYQKSAAK